MEGHPGDYVYPQPPINFHPHPQPHHQNFPPDFHPHHHQQNIPPDFHHFQNHPNPNFPHPNPLHAGPVHDLFDNNPNRQTPPFPNRKRLFSHSVHPPSNDCPDGLSFVKLYVVGLPRTITEAQVGAIFGEFGRILEIILLKDKRTGEQGECGFVKYATMEEGNRAVEALNDNYTFSGAPLPVRVRYAEKERQRLGIPLGEHVHKLYVGCINRLASKRDLEEIFSPYGVIEDIYIVRNDLKQSRGSAFIRLARRDMAIAAINALHGTYVMRGCDQPLIVRFADPKKPRIGDAMPTAFTGGPWCGPLPPNGNTNLSQPISLPPNSNTNLSQPIHPSLQSMNDGGSCSYSQPKEVPPSTSHQSGSFTMDDSVECDWSGHICPDGHTYYYNCVTCESRWEKPEEYALYEEHLDKLEQHQTSRQNSLCSSEQVPLQSSLWCQA